MRGGLKGLGPHRALLRIKNFIQGQPLDYAYPTMRRIPRRLKFAMRLPGISDGVWVDVGAGNGNYLSFMPVGSFGLDINENPSKSIHYWNFSQDFPEKSKGAADVIWCSNLIEHVIDPHRFLINIKKVLKSSRESSLLIACPNTVLFKRGPWKGTLAADHVNFFNLATLKLTLKYAGYKVKYAGCPSVSWMPLWISKILGPFGPTLLVEAQAIPDFQYGPTAHKIIDASGTIKFKDESLSNSDH